MEWKGKGNLKENVISALKYNSINLETAGACLFHLLLSFNTLNLYSY